MGSNFGAAVADQLIAQAREIDGEGRLGFYDLHRQGYGEANPTPEAGEFSDPRPRCRRLAGPGRRIQDDADRAGERWALGALPTPRDLRRRLIAIGIVDRSDAPLSGAEAAVAGAH
jgi:hypothetical protein